MGINPINFHIENGVKSYDELEKSLKKGVVITELFGYRSGLNVTSGFFSLRAQGYYKRDQKKEPIEQIIFSGNIYDVLLMVEEIADDLYFEMINGAGYGSPSVMLRRQLIIGKGEMR